MSSETVERALRQLVSEGGDGNHAVFSRGPAYFVCTAARGDLSILVEAAPSSALPREQALSPSRIQALRRAGFASRPGHKCLGRHVSLDGTDALPALAAELIALFDSVYQQAAGEVGVEVLLRDADRTANPTLIDAMRTMAKKRDHSYRTALYRSLLDSTLLLLTDAERPKKVGELMRFEVFAAFTSFDALRRYEPRGAAYDRVKGRDLFHRLLEFPVGSLLIDPKSTVGGELYRNELESLAGASYGARKR